MQMDPFTDTTLSYPILSYPLSVIPQPILVELFAPLYAIRIGAKNDRG